MQRCFGISSTCVLKAEKLRNHSKRAKAHRTKGQKYKCKRLQKGCIHVDTEKQRGSRDGSPQDNTRQLKHKERRNCSPEMMKLPLHGFIATAQIHCKKNRSCNMIPGLSLIPASTLHDKNSAFCNSSCLFGVKLMLEASREQAHSAW